MVLKYPFGEKHHLRKVCLLVSYVLTIFAITIVFREKGFFCEAELTPFWSYLEWIKGDFQLGVEIILNIGLFVPLGYLATMLFGTGRNKEFLIIFGGLCLSLLIEFLQFKYKLGLAEFDDVFNNTLGTAIGVVLFRICENRINKKYILDAIAACFVIIGFAFAVREAILPKASSVTEFAFQIDSVEDRQISGYAFPYGDDAGTFSYTIILEDTETGEQITLPTQTGIDRQDVNQYFNCEYDYSESGFIVTYDFIPESSKVLIDWDGVGLRATGTYIANDKLQCSDESPSYDGTDLQTLSESGVLLVHNAEYSCDVYQIGKKLYWIVGPGFDFEDDGSTYIQYQLWTTKVDSLPENRQQYGFDNIGFNFEEHEITDDMNCGHYRVAVCEIPIEYPISYIKTGYYDAHWIWKEIFRPVTKELM